MNGRREKMKSRAKPAVEKEHRSALDSKYQSYELPLFENDWPIYLDLVLLDAMTMYP